MANITRPRSSFSPDAAKRPEVTNDICRVLCLARGAQEETGPAHPDRYSQRASRPDYRNAVRNAFDGQVDHGQIVKVFDKGTSDERRYSPPEVIATVRTPITGDPIPSMICTSHVERSNLSMRTFMRRLTRLCLGFSKKLENLKHAVALYFAWYNFCRVHGSLRVTPAMEANVTDHIWTINELLTTGA